MGFRDKLSILLSRQQIADTVSRLAGEIGTDYHDKHPVLVGCLKGSFIFLADLVRCLDFPLEVEFINLSSYGSRRKTSGKVNVVQGLRTSLGDRHVLVVEDIVDTGLTTAFIMEYMAKQRPASLRLCSLMDKPSARQAPVTIDYSGFTVPNKFLVGYGLDDNQQFRHLPDICFMEEDA